MSVFGQRAKRLVASMDSRVVPLAKALVVMWATFLPAHLNADSTQGPERTFGEWGLFQEKGVCWITSNPIILAQPEENPENYYMFVSFFYGSAEPEISYYLNGLGNTDLVSIAGDQTSELFFYNDTYFPNSLRDLDFLRSMLKANEVSLQEIGSNDAIIKFSLRGFRAAYNEAARVCEFNSLGIESRAKL